MLSFACLLCRESRGAFYMCLIQQSLIFHSKNVIPKSHIPYSKVHSLHYIHPRANGAKRRSGRKPGARVTNFVLAELKVVARDK